MGAITAKDAINILISIAEEYVNRRVILITPEYLQEQQLQKASIQRAREFVVQMGKLINTDHPDEIQDELKEIYVYS
jgi:DNA polymerase/3'-5' exonuclease PolX